ncbi:hypothetical protein N7510_004605 [Penicillium lagena]|uniref:uncharacterized protein n=1 Tax=Penicillium lagena TaxID=94218 RepID=UPI002541E16C|nr:uncharacterized protein N7510_004605 [Penicillium lagena]KAJ5620621.1 hypothetical protein N7510_004605 [Penicillium lagena]
MSSLPRSSEGQSSQTPAIPVPNNPINQLLPPPSRNSHVNLDFSPINENGSFEFDRVLKTGRVFRRVKHKHVFRASWKPAYIVLRPNLLSVYKDEETTRLRASITLSEVTAVAPVKATRSSRQHVFGVFTPSKNYRFEATSERDAEDWISRIRTETPIGEDEKAFLALTKKPGPPAIQKQLIEDTTDHSDFDQTGRASSPELGRTVSPHRRAQRLSYTQEYSGNEITSYSELSDASPPTDRGQLRSMPSLNNLPRSVNNLSRSAPEEKPLSLPRDTSRQSVRDPERVVCHGYLQGLRIKGTVRQWKRLWVVLRPKSLAFYKDEQEYSALRVISMSQIIDAAEVDPMSRSKKFCLQIIAEEKTYRLCAPDEESLARWLGALKSILVARKKLEPSSTF